MSKRIFSYVLAFLLCLTQLVFLNVTQVRVQAETLRDYVIYPQPHSISYEPVDGQAAFILQNTFNVIKGEGIDAATLKRLEEVAAIKQMSINYAEAEAADATNIYLAVYNSQDSVATSLQAKYPNLADLMAKNDAYYLAASDNKFILIAKDSDSVFYGLTTLYHIFKQVESRTVRNFVIEDYADVVSRGFIEGYYGNPWSTMNRVDLMRWSGYYKLNTYFYAPKDDPKHNAKWRELYTDEELETKIKPLALAGQESKCNFVYALHPYMHSPIRYNNEENYQNDMQILKNKFAQVLQAGVRQIAILADDAGNFGARNYQRTLTDLTAWLQEQKATYPDLKTTLPFCAQEYMSNGQSYYRDFPDNVQVMMTGGKVWGEVSQRFTQVFTNNTGKGPYLWINWPCTDNSKKHLILGGYKDFLHVGVDPAKLQGIVLNPMQQSEPSKVAIFGNAAYAWNIWQDEATADKAWEDSFSFVDHNSAIKSEASEALKELAKHMINQNMDSRVRVLQESVELAPTLTAFRNALNKENYTAEQITELVAVFKNLTQAVRLYSEQGNPGLIGDRTDYDGRDANEQLQPWLDSWHDTNKAALAYLAALQAYMSKDYSSMLQSYSAAETAFKASKEHRFFYYDHYEVAEVGVQHIVPFIKALDSYLAKKVLLYANPDLITKTYISDVFVNPSVGEIENILDGNDETTTQFKQPNFLKKDNYVGVAFNNPITVNNVRFVFGEGKNHFYKSKLQYSFDGSNWQDVSGEVYSRPRNDGEPIVATDLNLPNVKAIRLIATQDNGDDLWLLIKGIDVNFPVKNKIKPYKIVEASLENLVVAPGGFNLQKAYDGNPKSEVWLRNSTNADNIPQDAAIIFSMESVQRIGGMQIYQGSSNKGDIPNNAVVEISNDKQTWQEYGTLTQTAQIFSKVAEARYVRIRNTAAKGVWWRFADLQIMPVGAQQFATTVKGVSLIVAKNPAINDRAKNNKFDYIVDGDEKTLAWLSANSGGNIPVNAGVELTFDRPINLGDIELLQGASDKMSTLILQYEDNGRWQELARVENANRRVLFNGNRQVASKIRILNGAAVNCWWQLYEIKVNVAPEANKDHIYSNLQDTGAIKSSLTRTAVSLTGGTLTLQPNDYIGFELEQVKNLLASNVNYAPAELSLEYSQDAQSWETLSNTSKQFSARFVRLVNKAAAQQTLTITNFDFDILQAAPIGKLISTDIELQPSWGDSRQNRAAFDGNIDTIQKFGGNPRKGNVALFDLGKAIDITSLRIYTVDTQTDYIRDTAVELSRDGHEWHTVLTIGDTTKDTDRTTPFGSINDAAKQADSNYPNKFYYGNDEITTDGEGVRYLRLRILADYPTRALAINEILLNRGAYISPEDNAAFDGTIEQPGHLPSYMTDGSLTTSYLPATPNGQITYTLGKQDHQGAIRVVQRGTASLAKVTGKFLNSTTNELTNVDLGYLAQPVNEFVWPTEQKLLALTFSWEEVLPEISEVFFLNGAETATTASKEKLQQLISAKPQTYANWDVDKQAAYDATVLRAQAVAKSQYLSELSLRTMITEVEKLTIGNAALATAEQKAEIQAFLDKNLSNEEHFYTTYSFANYERLHEKATQALADISLTAETAENLLNAIRACLANLQYSLFQREQAEQALKSFDLLDAANYSKASFKALQNSYNDLKALIAADKQGADNGRTEPSLFKEKLKSYQTCLQNLVDISELKALVAQTVNEELYTAESYSKYQEAKANAAALLASETATAEELQAAQNVLQAVYNNLQLKADSDLAALVAELEALPADDYTEVSYAALQSAITAAKADLAAQDTAAYQEHKQALLIAKNALVSVKALKAKLAAVELTDPTVYTRDSVAALEAERTKANALLHKATEEEVSQQILSLDAAYRNLLENAADLAEYQASLTLLNAADYEAASYNAYKAVYDQIMQLEVGNTSKQTLAALQAELADKISALKLLGEDNEPTAREVNLTAEVTVPQLQSAAKEITQQVKVSGTLQNADNRDLTLQVSLQAAAASKVKPEVGEKLYPYEISILADGKVIPAEGKFLVEISNVEAAPLYIYDEKAESNLTDFAYNASDKKLSFKTEHFSLYSLVLPLENDDAPVRVEPDTTATTASNADATVVKPTKTQLVWNNNVRENNAQQESAKFYQAVTKTGEVKHSAALIILVLLLLVAVQVKKQYR